jgi:hypothetical protein
MKDRKKTHKPVVSIPHLGSAKAEKGITQMQEQFCRYYAIDGLPQGEAAQKAGYVDYHTAASKFLNGRTYPLIVERVRELRAEVAKVHEVTYDSHIVQLAKIRDLSIAAGNYPAAVSAEKQRGAAAGLYISRSEVLVGRIDQMSKEDLTKEIARLVTEFPALRAVAMPTLEIDHVPNGEENVLFDEESDREFSTLDES